MNNQILTSAMCGFPIFVGAMAFLFFSKGDGEKRIRSVLWWSISAIAVPYLFYVWRSMTKTPSEVLIFASSLLICAPIWFTWLVLANKGEQYIEASRWVLWLCILPSFIYAISDSLNIWAELFATRKVELFVYTSMFGMFLVFGMWARDYEIVLFRDK